MLFENHKTLIIISIFINFVQNIQSMEHLLNRITLNPDVCFGKPTIRNMRYPVEMILDLLSAGMTYKELLDDYEDLEDADIRACLLFASKLTKVNSIRNVLVA
jgi:uncharacterized protein (DUF433 family)